MPDAQTKFLDLKIIFLTTQGSEVDKPHVPVGLHPTLYLGLYKLIIHYWLQITDDYEKLVAKFCIEYQKQVWC